MSIASQHDLQHLTIITISTKQNLHSISAMTTLMFMMLHHIALLLPAALRTAQAAGI